MKFSNSKALTGQLNKYEEMCNNIINVFWIKIFLKVVNIIAPNNCKTAHERSHLLDYEFNNKLNLGSTAGQGS